MNFLRLALITDIPLGEEAVGEKNPLSVVKGLGVGMSVVGKVVKTVVHKNRLSVGIDRCFSDLTGQQHEGHHLRKPDGTMSSWPKDTILLPPSLLL